MGRDKDPNRELMLARGSKTGAYDADAPDQWKFDLRHGEGEVKALAWIKSTTIALNHKSPFSVDEHGKPLYLDRMAVDCGWALQTARNVAAGLEKSGRIRLEKGKRIWYAAEVPLAYTDLPAASDETGEADDDYAPEEGDQTDQKPATKSATNNSVHGCCTTYVVDFIKKLPAEKRAVAEAKIGAFASWKSEFLADGMAALRSITERVEDITYREIGIPKKRLPKRREPECKWVQLSLLAEPNFVHGCLPDQNGNSVQGIESGSYKVKNGLYKTNGGDPSLYTATTTTKPLEGAVSVSQSPTDRPTDESPSPEEIKAVLLALLGQKLPGETPSLNLCKRIAFKLRGAPSGLLMKRISDRRKAITSMGMVENLADDVGKRWLADEAIRQTGREPSRADNIAYLEREWLNLSEDERADYLKAFPELREIAKGAAS